MVCWLFCRHASCPLTEWLMLFYSPDSQCMGFRAVNRRRLCGCAHVYACVCMCLCAYASVCAFCFCFAHSRPPPQALFWQSVAHILTTAVAEKLSWILYQTHWFGNGQLVWILRQATRQRVLRSHSTCHAEHTFSNKAENIHYSSFNIHFH